MANIYSNNFLNNKNEAVPSESTVQFLLNYSKALKVVGYKSLQFNTFLN